MRSVKFLVSIIFCGLSFVSYSQTHDESILQPVKQQLEAYNNRDIALFVDAYADSVKVYSFPGKLLYQGRDKLEARYDVMFNTRPDLHAEIVNRMVVGNTVIDQESVTFDKKAPKVNAIAIYKVHNGKITEIYFIQ